MIHRKARSLMSAPEAIATVAAAALSQTASQQTRPTGSTVTHNADGTQTITGPVLGTDATGTSVTTATHVGDTTPPGVPTGITAWSGDGTVHVAWDGTLAGGIPADFDHVTLLANGTAFAALTSAGSATCKAVTVGATVSVTATSEDDVCAMDGTPAHNVSAASAAVSVTVTDVADGLSKLIRETEDGVDVGKSADGTTYAEGSMVTRQGTDGTFSVLKALSGALTSVASFGESLIELGKNSTSAVIKFCAGKLSISYATNTSGVYNATISSTDGILVTSEASTTAECLHTLTTAEGNEGFLPAGTRIHSYANVSPYDDKLGAFADVMLDCTQPDGSENQMLISLMSGCRLNGTTTEPTVNLSMSTKDGSAAATSYAAQMPFRRLITAIQPVVLYNGGAALDYGTAPGAGTKGTVTLSEDVSHFVELTIVYRATLTAGPNGGNKSVTVPVYPGAYAQLDCVKWDNDGRDVCQFASASYLLSGTSLSYASRVYGQIYTGSNGGTYVGTDGGQPWIIRVTGRR